MRVLLSLCVAGAINHNASPKLFDEYAPPVKPLLAIKSRLGSTDGSTDDSHGEHLRYEASAREGPRVSAVDAVLHGHASLSDLDAVHGAVDGLHEHLTDMLNTSATEWSRGLHAQLTDMLNTPGSRRASGLSSMEDGLWQISLSPAVDAPALPNMHPDGHTHVAVLDAGLASPPTVSEMQKLGKSAKMLSVLHVMLTPIVTKLTSAMAHMPPEAKASAQEMLKHITALDALSRMSLMLLQNVEAAKHGTTKDKNKAIIKLVVGMKYIQDGVRRNLLAMRTYEHPTLPGPTAKMHAVLEGHVDGEADNVD